MTDVVVIFILTIIVFGQPGLLSARATYPSLRRRDGMCGGDRKEPKLTPVHTVETYSLSRPLEFEAVFSGERNNPNIPL